MSGRLDVWEADVWEAGDCWLVEQEQHEALSCRLSPIRSSNSQLQLTKTDKLISTFCQFCGFLNSEKSTPSIKILCL